MYISLLTFAVTIDFTVSFLTRQSPNNQTKTHFDITNVGAMEAISEYIVRFKLVNTTSADLAVQNFFGEDDQGETNLLKTIRLLREAVADTQERYREVAFYHCNGEQILEAHNFVHSCREALPKLQHDVDELRRQLGKCLYTIQSFYSNTNWVELKRTRTYPDFGNKSRPLLIIAGANLDSCLDMPNDIKDCKNNLLLENILTSGYYEGRGITKPAKEQGKPAGKCSHGGLNDNSRKIIARCGINKETTIEELSPHFHLHNEAYLAAVAATKHFLIGQDNVLSIIGDQTFDELFSIKKRKAVSLSFAVDFSSSMSEEISSVKDQLIQLVTSVQGSENEPADYVLSLFNDPADLHKWFRTTNGYEMIQIIANVTVDGGGDCPEFAAVGMLKAIELSRKDSTLLVFTDADAKDEDRRKEVEQAAVKKNITINPILSGQCTRKKRQISGPDTIDFFEEVANITGGKIYHGNKSNIREVIADVVQATLPTSEVVVELFTMKSFQTVQSVTVDDSIRVLKISIKGAKSEAEADFLYPNGTVESFSSGKSRRMFTRNREIIMSLQGIPSGVYRLQKNNKETVWQVNITAQSSISMEAELLQQTDNISLATLAGSPILGQKYTIILTIYNFKNGVCNAVCLVNTSGHVLSALQPTQSVSDIDTQCAVELTVPNQAFMLKLNGTDRFGKLLFRSKATVYRPTNVELKILTLLDNIPTQIEQKIQFEVIQTEVEEGTYQLRIKDDQYAVTNITPSNFILSEGESLKGSFDLLPTRLGILRYTISLSLKGSTDIKQTITNNILVTDVERPICSINTAEVACGVLSLNTANCSKFDWNASATVEFSRTELEMITSSAGNKTHLEYENFEGLTTGPLQINISGSCCIPSVIISIVDKDGYISQCHLEMSGGKPVESVESRSTYTERPKTDNSYHTIIIAVSVCVVLVVLAIIIACVIIKRKQIRKWRPNQQDQKEIVLEEKLLNPEVSNTNLQE